MLLAQQEAITEEVVDHDETPLEKISLLPATAAALLAQAWAAASETPVDQGMADFRQGRFEARFEAFKDAMKDENLPEEVMEDLKWMAWNAGWHAWNTRTYSVQWYWRLALAPLSYLFIDPEFYQERAAEDLERWEGHTSSLEASNLFEPELFENMKECAWNLA